MPGDEGDVDVAALTDRFAVVEGFQRGEEAGVFLGEAREGVEDLRAFVDREGGPFRLGSAGGFHRVGDVVGGALGDLGEGLAGGGVRGREGLTRRGEAAVDEMAEAAVVFGDPGEGLGGGFRGGAVGHAVEDFLDGHGVRSCWQMRRVGRLPTLRALGERGADASGGSICKRANGFWVGIPQPIAWRKPAE